MKGTLKFSHKFKRPAQVLYDVLQKIYSRALFLDIQLPDPYQGLWNLPPAMGLQPQPRIPFDVYEGWRFSIVPLQTYLIGILWQPNGHPGFAAIRRDTLFYQEVTYLIEMVPLYISDLCFEMEVSLSKTLLDPSKSPWTHQFACRRIARLLQNFMRSTFSQISPMAWRLGQKIKQCYLAPYLFSLEIAKLWHS